MGQPAKKILVIEDNALLRKWILKILTDEGYDCKEAVDGVSGITLAPLFLPDITLCDVEMPRMNGFEVFERLSQNASTAAIPFIFITGLSSREDMRKGMSAGADDYLTKPFTAAEIIDTVRMRLEKKQAHDEAVQKHLQVAKEKFSQRISRDGLTQLPNRHALSKYLRDWPKKESQLVCATILSVGIDNLGHITEAFGNSCEKKVIKSTADRLKACLHADTLVFRGRHETFDVLIPNSDDPQKAEAMMKKLVRVLNEPVHFGDQVLRKRISIGCSFYNPKNKHALETVMDHSETARHYAKKQTEKNYQFYSADMQKFVAERLLLENSLFKALDSHELVLFYQPQLDIKTQKITAVEALIRWKSPEIGMVSPLQFIPIAEENGLILPIGEWVLHEGARQLKEWQDQGFRLRMAINISGRQLESGDLVARVEKVLAETSVSPASLELEITESLLMKNAESTIAQMKALKEKGVMIAIDDFGTGYSSLGSLKKFPFDTLKIDRSFVRDIENPNSDMEILTAILKMAQSLKLKTIAEGVETKEQLECLLQSHCDEYQGFLFSKPVPASEARVLLQNAPQN